MKEITFIVGAGASAEFGLPTGKALLERISSLASIAFDGVRQAYNIDADLKSAFREISDTTTAAEAIGATMERAAWLSSVALMAPSIDNLLHSHRDDPKVDKIGKIFICKTILQAEANSFLADTLQRDGHTRVFELVRQTASGPEYISDKWIGKLFSLLVEMRNFHEFLSLLRRLNFLCFNYDRCIEHAVTSLATRYYRLTAEQAQEVLEAIKITHIYGSVGALRLWQGRLEGFGNTCTPLALVADGIQTFTDDTRRMEVKSIVEEVLGRSSIAVFLGYGFLQINNRLLFEGRTFDFNKVLATVRGLSDASISVVRSEVEQAFLFGNDSPDLRVAKLAGGRSDKVILGNQTCAELIDYHSILLRSAFADFD